MKGELEVDVSLLEVLQPVMHCRSEWVSGPHPTNHL